MLPIFRECELGYSYSDDNVLVFFGKKAATVNALQHKFNDLQFYKLQQTHSDRLVEACKIAENADAHWTTEKKCALLISTADCLPIFILDNITRTIIAIHAGWKGVSNQIVYKSLRVLITKKTSADQFTVWIGPHILTKSFEVHKDVLELLLSASYSNNKNDHYTAISDKFLVDLKSIVMSQIKAALGGGFQLNEICLNTKEDLNFNSYRRDKAESNRNLSFITLIK